MPAAEPAAPPPTKPKVSKKRAKAAAAAATPTTAATPSSSARYFRSLSHNNLGLVVHTHVPLSPSSIIWYRPKGGDAV